MLLGFVPQPNLPLPTLILIDRMSIINYQLSIINYQLSIINYQLSIINYQLILKPTISPS
ncbi:hypothetical protein C7B77_17785 [Chamaesiphon polymorphus CCALA 037]|uniref:Uncharacterized protein n=1 Tax=Chamaesiphon polymorphus CCALA 037 TaxID=2107692 RepID=A0A2T1GB77_9CYAN|nr:hypothetical protein C7B77_17785 [Chamaesiphon polymorphus CCALA 037]